MGDAETEVAILRDWRVNTVDPKLRTHSQRLAEIEESQNESTMAAGIFGFQGSAPASYVPPQVSGNVKISGNVHIQ